MLQVRTHLGRPNWRKVFSKMASNYKGHRIGMYEYIYIYILLNSLSTFCFSTFVIIMVKKNKNKCEQKEKKEENPSNHFRHITSYPSHIKTIHVNDIQHFIGIPWFKVLMERNITRFCQLSDVWDVGVECLSFPVFGVQALTNSQCYF